LKNRIFGPCVVILMTIFLSLAVHSGTSFAGLSTWEASKTEGDFTGTTIIATGEGFGGVSGEWWCENFIVFGTIDVAPYNNTTELPPNDDNHPGALIIHAKNIHIAESGTINAEGAGYKGGNFGTGGAGGSGGDYGIAPFGGGTEGTDPAINGSTGSNGNGGYGGDGGYGGTKGDQGNPGNYNVGGKGGKAGLAAFSPGSDGKYSISSDPVMNNNTNVLMGSSGGGGGGGGGAGGGGGGGCGPLFHGGEGRWAWRPRWARRTRRKRRRIRKTICTAKS
jgi:hypothetical protein